MKRSHFAITASVFAVGTFSAFYFFIPSIASVHYDSDKAETATTTVLTASTTAPLVAHLPTPNPLKAIYMTACVAGTPSWREKLVQMVDTTELNAIVIDIKDYSGTISLDPEDPTIDTGGSGCHVSDMKAFVKELHDYHIYAIGRITVFQDPYYTAKHPELAVKKKSDGGVWRDYKGLAFIDVSAKPYWEYVARLAVDSYKIGFDEINFDYIRFPSDGNMSDTNYTWTGTTTKPLALDHFFTYLEGAVKPSGAVISADLFGMTTTNYDDLNIGQVLEFALEHFDYVDPMVYPSHYPPQFNGWANPNDHMYDVIHLSMGTAVERARATTTPITYLGGARVGTSTPALYTKEVFDTKKLRPWLQDFNYGGHYGPVEVRAQIQATYDVGLTSWLLWDAGNKYTPEALLPATSTVAH